MPSAGTAGTGGRAGGGAAASARRARDRRRAGRRADRRARRRGSGKPVCARRAAGRRAPPSVSPREHGERGAAGLQQADAGMRGEQRVEHGHGRREVARLRRLAARRGSPRRCGAWRRDRPRAAGSRRRSGRRVPRRGAAGRGRGVSAAREAAAAAEEKQGGEPERRNLPQSRLPAPPSRASIVVFPLPGKPRAHASVTPVARQAPRARAGRRRVFIRLNLG